MIGSSSKVGSKMSGRPNPFKAPKSRRSYPMMSESRLENPHEPHPPGGPPPPPHTRGPPSQPRHLSDHPYYPTHNYHHHQQQQQKRRRTSEDFLMFCRMILEHENYEEMRQTNDNLQEARVRHSSSPLGSTGSSGNESLPPPTASIKDMDTTDNENNEEIDVSTNRRKQRKNEISDEEEDSYDQITCYCNKPFANRPMIECSSCLTWIHLTCAKIKRSHIPDTWNCSKCTSSSSTTSSSSAAKRKPRTSRKRKTSTSASPPPPPPAPSSVSMAATAHISTTLTATSV